MTIINKVLIIGGTHGNEWTGIYAVKKYADSLRSEFPQLDLHFIMANPEAYKMNRRFKDEDLNRAFQFLSEERDNSYEHQRAKELKTLIDSEPCFVLDLHTTTANVGKTIIISHDQPLNFHVAARLIKSIPKCRIILAPDPHKKYLASQSHFGMMIEVGPVANGVIDGQVLESTILLIKEILTILSTPMTLIEQTVEIYEEAEDVFYPQDDNEQLLGYIHPEFQGQDFIPIRGKYRPFKTFQGEDVVLESQEERYPIFINEAAYYPRKLAYTLCRKKMLQIDASNKNQPH